MITAKINAMENRKIEKNQYNLKLIFIKDQQN